MLSSFRETFWSIQIPEGSETVTMALDAEDKVSDSIRNPSRRAGNQLVSRYESESVHIHASVGVECRCRSIGRATNQDPIKNRLKKSGQKQKQATQSPRWNSVVATTRAKAWSRITRRLRSGIAKPPNGITPWLNTIWASATNGVWPRIRSRSCSRFLGGPVEAVKWYRKAAEQNYAPAQNNLGLCYEHGKAWRRIGWRPVSQSRRTE